VWHRCLAILLSSRGKRVVCFLVALWVINAYDLVMTIVAHQHGLLEESNPIAARILPLGPGMVLLYKTILVAGGSASLLVFRQRFIAEFASAALLLIYCMVAVRWKLCYDIYEVTCANAMGFIEHNPPTGWVSFLPF
jgi:hypothetical protein